MVLRKKIQLYYLDITHESRLFAVVSHKIVHSDVFLFICVSVSVCVNVFFCVNRRSSFQPSIQGGVKTFSASLPACVYV